MFRKISQTIARCRGVAGKVKTEKNKVKSDSKHLYKLIKGFNEQDGKLLLNHLDS